ncbi:hypothetical protein BVI434_1980024 [Burkholderia vietnamiensis]|nr:hypothetical protein BVI434_1980024 [Burkholderia vietnamiensis]
MAALRRRVDAAAHGRRRPSAAREAGAWVRVGSVGRRPRGEQLRAKPAMRVGARVLRVRVDLHRVARDVERRGVDADRRRVLQHLRGAVRHRHQQRRPGDHERRGQHARQLHSHLPGKAEPVEHVVDHAARLVPRRDDHVAGCEVLIERQPAAHVRVRRACDHHVVVGEPVEVVDARRGGGRFLVIAEREVDPACRQLVGRDLAVGVNDAEAQMRCDALDAREQRRQHGERRVVAGGEHERAVTLRGIEATRAGEPLRHRVERLGGPAGDIVGAHGRLHLVAEPHEQRVADRVAQPRERVAQRRRAHREFVRGSGDRAVAVQRVEREQQVQIETAQVGMHHVQIRMKKLHFLQQCRDRSMSLRAAPRATARSLQSAVNPGRRRAPRRANRHPFRDRRRRAANPAFHHRTGRLREGRA